MMNVVSMVKALESPTIVQSFMALWEHDEGSVQFWRASSNFVYVWKRGYDRYFLRFSNARDRSLEQIQAEIHFMKYLGEQGYPVVSPLPSKNGKLIETVQDRSESYLGVVFSQAEGISLDWETMTDQQWEQWGNSLGFLHQLSKGYPASHAKRTSWKEIGGFMEAILERHPLEVEARVELAQVNAWLHSMSSSSNQYGLVHYDFQLDNVFWNEADATFSVIDFDDSMYHWFALDLANALADVREGQGDEEKMALFLKGYRSVNEITEEQIQLMPKFARFGQLYQFTKLLQALGTETEIQIAPDWYHRLRQKLQGILTLRREAFRRPWE
ncbi:phosphotransferase enzyme family protein [Brevibacillus choshinensis]|uniref:phosphotransferase enzyme family protein n=1 Tax=Brevibacillus choshinensis TaxID=54911 RepID=UPI002E1E6511|nr:phosphotransferase [Brevibacillus choshinensis]MED4749986.1 phosphotransferase [Brevibacillus choshinensis]